MNENALVLCDDGSMIYDRFILHPTHLDIPKNVSSQEWQDLGYRLKHIETSLSWVIGDWAYYANSIWKFSYETIAEHYGYETSTLMTYASIARNIPTLIRNQGLSFSHHRLVTKLPPEQQKMWLNAAVENGWTLNQMYRVMLQNNRLPKSVSLNKIQKQVESISASLMRVHGDLSPKERQKLVRLFRELADKIEGE
ncbi:MAG: hypothetical protein ABI835_10920 [Chloroflexota bacterium]